MKTIWVVTKGQHDDYEIKGIAGTKEKADIISLGFEDRNDPLPMEIDKYYDKCLVIKERNKRPFKLFFFDHQEFLVQRLECDEEYPDTAQIICSEDDYKEVIVWAKARFEAGKLADNLLRIWRHKGDAAFERKIQQLGIPKKTKKKG